MNPTGLIYRIGTDVQRTAGIIAFTDRFQAAITQHLKTPATKQSSTVFSVYVCTFKCSEKKLRVQSNGQGPEVPCKTSRAYLICIMQCVIASCVQTKLVLFVAVHRH